MNLTLGSGKAVHAPYVAKNGEVCEFTLCGGNRATERYRKTSREVTCKNCLKALAAQAVAETPVAQPVETQDDVMSQADAAELCGVQVYDPFRGLAYCNKSAHHSRVTGGPEHRGNYDEMDAAHAEALVANEQADAGAAASVKACASAEAIETHREF